MAQAIVISEKVIEAINALQEKLYAKHWTEHSRASFIYATIHCIHALEEIKELLSEAFLQFEKEGKSISGLQENLKELEKLIQLLDRNNKLEQTRVQKTKEKQIGILADDLTNPELYSFLEQKVLGFILKTRFLVERLSIIEKKETTGIFHSKASKKVLELLEEKEQELQTLKKKYEEIKHSSFLAKIEENTVHDLEKEINELSKKQEGEQRLLEHLLETYRKMLEELQTSYLVLFEKFRTIEETSTQLENKTKELTVMLKKERDYAKRIVLDIENETLKLRNNYSRQILSLEEQKANSEKIALQEASKKNQELQKTIQEKDELVKNLKEIIDAKDKFIEQLLKEKQKKTKEKKHS